MWCVGILFVAVTLKIVFACHIVQVHQMSDEVKDSVKPKKYWRSNFYMIPKRPPAKGYLPPLLPIQNEYTEVTETPPWGIADFARAISGCWQVENPEKLQPEFQKYMEKTNVTVKLNATVLPKVTNSTMSISVTVDDKQTMNVTIRGTIVIGMNNLNYTIRGDTDSQTIGEKIVYWEGEKKTWNVTFGFEDNVLTEYVMNRNNTEKIEYVEMFRFSIDKNNPNKVMKENTWGTTQLVNSSCLNYSNFSK